MITADNYKDHVGEKVEVQITGYSAGFVYPEENTLINYVNGTWVLRSEDIDTEDHLWSFKSDGDFSIELEAIEKGGSK